MELGELGELAAVPRGGEAGPGPAPAPVDTHAALVAMTKTIRARDRRGRAQTDEGPLTTTEHDMALALMFPGILCLVPVSQTRLKRPADARERLRLVAAIGALAVVAIAAGGLASLAAGTPVLSRAPAEPAARSPLAWLPQFQMPSADANDALERAERAASRARLALERARREGTLNPAELSALEFRLEQLGDTPSSTSTSPSAGAPVRDTKPATVRQYRRNLDEGKRAL